MQILCEELHTRIDVVDEERYDIEAKVLHNTREVKNTTVAKIKKKLKKKTKINVYINIK